MTTMKQESAKTNIGKEFHLWLLQLNKMEIYLKSNEIPDFEECELMLILQTNSSQNFLENSYWKTICLKYVCRPDSFGSKAAKNLMKERNVELTKKMLKVLGRIPFVSLSEDEGTKMRYVEDCKKDLVKDLEGIIKDFVVDINESEGSEGSSTDTEEEERQKRKKKKKSIETNVLGFLDENSPDSESNDEVSQTVERNEEVKWFKKQYLEQNLSCKTLESSEMYWKERRKTYPNVIRLVCRYRSIACTSIFEESCFSTINKIYTEDRESLKDETVEAMMFCKKNHPFFNGK